MDSKRTCINCKHLEGWTEYGNYLWDCRHQQGSEIFAEDADLNSAMKCPYYEEVRYDDVATS